MYKIVVDRSHALLRLDMHGMLSRADADQLVADLIAQITAARLPSYVMIIDVSRCPVQAQDMIAAMGDHLTKMKMRAPSPSSPAPRWSACKSAASSTSP